MAVVERVRISAADGCTAALALDGDACAPSTGGRATAMTPAARTAPPIIIRFIGLPLSGLNTWWTSRGPTNTLPERRPDRIRETTETRSIVGCNGALHPPVTRYEGIHVEALPFSSPPRYGKQ